MSIPVPVKLKEWSQVPRLLGEYVMKTKRKEFKERSHQPSDEYKWAQTVVAQWIEHWPEN